MNRETVTIAAAQPGFDLNAASHLNRSSLHNAAAAALWAPLPKRTLMPEASPAVVPAR